MDPITIELSCSVCDQSLTAHELNAVQTEHVIDAWSRTHAHTPAERDTYRRYLTELGDS